MRVSALVVAGLFASICRSARTRRASRAANLVERAAEADPRGTKDMGRLLRVASLDELGALDLEGDIISAGLSHHPPGWRSAYQSRTPELGFIDAPNMPRPRSWTHVCQILLVFIVAALSASKLTGAFARGTGAGSLLGLLELVTALALYVVSGPAIILLNKHIMKHYEFHFPIFLAGLGDALLMIATRVAVALKWKHVETRQLSWQRYWRIVVPINACNFLAQSFGMCAILYISIPEIQILKSTMTVLVLFMAWLFVDEPINPILVASILCITCGVFLSAIVDAEGQTGAGVASITLMGVLFSLSGNVFGAAHNIMSQVLMDNMSLFDGIYYSSPTFVLMSTLVAGLMEARGLANFDYSAALVGLLVGHALLTGVIVLSSLWFVKLAGALTMRVVSQARSVGLILCSVYFFHESCTGLQYLGYAIAMIGISMFDYGKQVLHASTSKDIANDVKAKAVDAFRTRPMSPKAKLAKSGDLASK